MKKFEKPQIEVIKINCEDIIMTSGSSPFGLNFGNGDNHDGINMGSKSEDNVFGY